MNSYRVESFGSDCLGNITGYRVVSGVGFNRVTAPNGVFVGNIYEVGSFTKAYNKAVTFCDNLNKEVHHD